MKVFVHTIQYIIASLGAVLGYLLGDLDGFLIALIVFVVADYVTGVVSAFVQKKISSKTGFIGILKKMCIFIVVAIANVLDVNLLEHAILRTAVIFFYISNEGISLIENLSIIGVPVPEKIKDVLVQLKKKGDSDDEL